MSKIPLYIYRAANFLNACRIPILPMALTVINRIIFSCYIGLGAQIGRDVTLGYGGLGVVIHHRAKIGDRVRIGAGVTIGGRSEIWEVPTIGDDVVIGTGAKVLGDIVLGDRVQVGANAVVLRSVPSDCISVGVPAVTKRK